MTEAVLREGQSVIPRKMNSVSKAANGAKQA